MCAGNTWFAKTFEGAPSGPSRPDVVIKQDHVPTDQEVTNFNTQHPDEKGKWYDPAIAQTADKEAAVATAANATPVLPDLTDYFVRDARRRQAQMMTAGVSRRSTFLTGALGAPNPRASLLGGY